MKTEIQSNGCIKYTWERPAVNPLELIMRECRVKTMRIIGSDGEGIEVRRI